MDQDMNVAEDYQDFFSPFAAYETFTLPDGKQTITFKVMSEGDRMKYQQSTNRPINIDRKKDTASISPDVAADRVKLIETSVTNWSLMRKSDDGWIPVPFSDANLRNWIRTADPRIISKLERAIQQANPWMQAEMSIADIDEEIENLQVLRDTKLREESEKNF